MPRRYTDADLLDALHEFADEHGEPPTQAAVTDDPDLPSTTPYYSRFGSWNAALDAAGLDPHARRYSDAELRDALRGFANDHDGRPPTAPEADEREDLPSATAFVYHFGSWNAAVEAAGLDPRARRRSDEELLADLRECAESGEYPTCSVAADREDMASPPTYITRFGSWNDALEAAGVATFDS